MPFNGGSGGGGDGGGGGGLILRTFWEGNGESLSAPSGGANAPTDLDVTLSANVSYRQARSLYVSGSDNRRAGTQLVVPDGIVTTSPVDLIMEWFTDGTSTEAVRWDLYIVEVPSGTILNSTTIEQPAVTRTDAAPGVANQVITSRFSADLGDLVAGDMFGFTLWRLGSTDANPDDAGVLSLAWDGFFLQ